MQNNEQQQTVCQNGLTLKVCENHDRNLPMDFLYVKAECENCGQNLSRKIMENFDFLIQFTREKKALAFQIAADFENTDFFEFALSHDADYVKECRCSGRRFYVIRFWLPEFDTEEQRADRRKRIIRHQEENRLLNWMTLLKNQERTEEPNTTIVRFPNATSYLFSTGCVHWVIDPMFQVGVDTPEIDKAAPYFKNYRFCIITHSHGDHFQTDLYRRLQDCPMQIIVSSEVYPSISWQQVIDPKKFIIVSPGETIDMYGIKIQCLRGLHQEANVSQVESSSFLITLPDGGRLYFPVDVRNFHPEAIPDAAKNADYVFSHIWLGRVNALGSQFPRLNDLSDLLASLNAKTVIMNHLVETSRSLDAMWFRRHAGMVAMNMAKQKCGSNVFIPSHGDMLKLSSAYQPDRFRLWQDSRQDYFLSKLGCSVKTDVVNWFEICLKKNIPVIEITGSLLCRLTSDEHTALNMLINQWRKMRDTVLSVHLSDVPLKDNVEAGMDKFRKINRETLAIHADRGTLHVPSCSVDFFREHEEYVLNSFHSAIAPLIEHGVIVGIENMHMQFGNVNDGTRRYGIIPSEWIEFTEKLSQTFPGKESLIGLHLDIGHAYANGCFSSEYPYEKWIESADSVKSILKINGMHIHQFQESISSFNGFPEGHHSILDRVCASPSLLPLFDAWENGRLNAPMILEIIRGMDPQPFQSYDFLCQK